MAALVRLVAALLLALVAAPLAAQASNGAAFPPLTGRVVDGAGLLSSAQQVDLTSKLAALEAQSGRQLVVATVPSLNGRTIEDYGNRLGRHWRIGDEKKDDGVILLVAPAERKVRIETGYGARVVLTDAVASVIVRNSILPRFKAGDMAGGIVAGTEQIIEMLTLPPAEAQRRAAEIGRREAERREDGPGVVPILFWMIVIAFVIMPMVRSASGRRFGRGRRGRGLGGAPIIVWGPGWGGGGSSFGGGLGGGGFDGGFSGGGGSFGGGGSSGSW